MRMVLQLGLAGLFLMAMAHPVVAQVTTATILGTVVDESGAVLPGVSISVRNPETGVTRTFVANGHGQYRVTQLDLGEYDVRAELSGFKTGVRAGIKLTLGLEAVVDFTLTVGEIAEEVLVTGEQPLVETTQSAVTGLVDDRQIRDLPLNGRDFLQLALLEPGVSNVTVASSEISKGFGAKLSFAGARPYQTSFLLDGTDINTFTNLGSPGSVAGVVLGVDTVQEFQVLVSSYSAEFGRAGGGIVNAVTRSGTNNLHGSAFEFHRNDNLDARNFFDVGDAPEFKRNQFGFTLGGPIVANRSFFFGSYEGLRERLGITRIGTVPTAAARQGILPVAGSPGLTRTVPVSVAIRPYLALYPLPNGRDFGDGRAEYAFSASEPTDEDYFVVKIDHRLSDSLSFFVRYSFDDAAKLGAKDLPVFSDLQTSRAQYVTFETKKIFSQSSINQSRFAYNHTKILGDDLALVTVDPSLAFIPGPFGSLGVSGLSNPGTQIRSPLKNILKTFEYADDLSVIAGRHSLRMGVNIKRYHFNIDTPRSAAGEYSFPSLERFLANRPDRLTAAAPGSSSAREVRQSLFGLYVQDDLRMTSRLMVNLGLRYEFITVPTEVNDRVAHIRDPLNDQAPILGDPLFENPSLKNFGPRLGFAWDAFGHGRTAVRGGAGVFFDQVLPNYVRQVIAQNPPFFATSVIRDPAFPDAIEALRAGAGLQGGVALIEAIEFGLRQPSMYHYNLTVQQQLGGSTALTVGYVGSRGVHLLRLVDANTASPEILPDGRKFFAPGLRNRNPAFSAVNIRRADSNSFYNGLLVKLNQRFTQGFQYQVSYTWGKSIDDSSTAAGSSDLGAGIPQDPDDLKSDRGLSDFDVRQNFVVNFGYELPFARQSVGLAGVLAKGWQVSGIVRLTSGAPFEAGISFFRAPTLGRLSNGQRPNLVPGRSNNPVLGGADLYFDPTAFELQPVGFYGDLGRNTLIGPGVAEVNFSLIKNNALRDGTNLQLRIELFNALNRPNFAQPAAVIFNASGRVASAGRITSTETTSRQIQLALKLTF